MANANVVAVLAFGSDLFDHAVAGGHDRGAVRRRPVHARVHFCGHQQRVAPQAVARGDAHVLAANRAPHEELARGASLPVVKVRGPVARAETVELVRLAACRDEGCEQFADLTVDALRLALHVEKEFHAVAHAHLLAKVGVVGVDAHDLQDQVVGHALLGSRVVQARVEALVLHLVVVAEHGRRDALLRQGGARLVPASCNARDGHLVRAGVVENADAHGLAAGPGGRRQGSDPNLVAGQQEALREYWARGIDHRAHLPGLRAEPRQNARQRIALLHPPGRQRPAREVVGLVLLLERGLGQDGGLRCGGIRNPLRAPRQQLASRGTARLFGRLRADHQCGHLDGIHLLSVLARQDPVELDQPDVGLLRQVCPVGVAQRRAVGVKLERIERRHPLRLRLGHRGQTRHQSHVVLVLQVVAMAAALLDRIGNVGGRRDSSARDDQFVRLGERPPQTVHPGDRQRQRRIAQAFEDVARAFLGIHGAGDGDENGKRADPAGKAGAQEPAEAAALPAVGMVADVDFRERAARPPEIGMRAAA